MIQVALLITLSDEYLSSSRCIASTISIVPRQLIINGIMTLIENNLKNSDNTIVNNGEEDVDTKPEAVMPQLPCNTIFFATAMCINVSSSG